MYNHAMIEPVGGHGASKSATATSSRPCGLGDQARVEPQARVVRCGRQAGVDDRAAAVRLAPDPAPTARGGRRGRRRDPAAAELELMVGVGISSEFHEHVRQFSAERGVGPDSSG